MYLANFFSRAEAHRRPSPHTAHAAWQRSTTRKKVRVANWCCSKIIVGTPFPRQAAAGPRDPPGQAFCCPTNRQGSESRGGGRPFRAAGGGFGRCVAVGHATRRRTDQLEARGNNAELRDWNTLGCGVWLLRSCRWPARLGGYAALGHPGKPGVAGDWRWSGAQCQRE
jgi:hypothetical protein